MRFWLCCTTIGLAGHRSLCGVSAATPAKAYIDAPLCPDHKTAMTELAR
jgi:hypothetical protein